MDRENDAKSDILVSRWFRLILGLGGDFNHRRGTVLGVKAFLTKASPGQNKKVAAIMIIGFKTREINLWGFSGAKHVLSFSF